MYTIALLLLLAGAGPSESKEARATPDDDDKIEKPEKTQRLKFMQESLKGYVFTAGADKPMELQGEPVLRWNNPVNGDRDGALFLWTARGVPQAAVQVFQTKDGYWLHEFQSLSADPFQTTMDGVPGWRPARAGIEMKPAPDAPVPAQSDRQRLVQMRSIVEEYKAVDDFEDKQSRWELRLLAKPVYRYADTGRGIIDGALWAFVHGTDPEVFVVLEARETPTGREWQIGMAPMTAYAVEVSRKNNAVWKAPLRPQPGNPREPFFMRLYRP